eukprot:CAMPEP_0197030904 /NCGR_PEP_ID=MMETSP1384-20130603/10033_1 /TAXON_ID=29189 /ORGANISM="Ammonia sp." /LENGTH=132 /DNA_ID=CAMNT_0042460337 /DNA_START=101 /DNA_END=499 /DNA_ORIENTATION=+
MKQERHRQIIFNDDLAMTLCKHDQLHWHQKRGINSVLVVFADEFVPIFHHQLLSKRDILKIKQEILFPLQQPFIITIFFRVTAILILHQMIVMNATERSAVIKAFVIFQFMRLNTTPSEIHMSGSILTLKGT